MNTVKFLKTSNSKHGFIRSINALISTEDGRPQYFVRDEDTHYSVEILDNDGVETDKLLELFGASVPQGIPYVLFNEDIDKCRFSAYDKSANSCGRMLVSKKIPEKDFDAFFEKQLSTMQKHIDIMFPTTPKIVVFKATQEQVFNDSVGSFQLGSSLYWELSEDGDLVSCADTPKLILLNRSLKHKNLPHYREEAIYESYNWEKVFEG